MTEAERLAEALRIGIVDDPYVAGIHQFLVAGDVPRTMQGLMGYCDIEAMVTAAGPFQPESGRHIQPVVTSIPMYTLENPLAR